MIKPIFISIAMILPAVLNASTPIQLQPVVAVKDTGDVFGTDADTSTYPNAGMNTMPTKEVGTEKNKDNPNAPIAKPDEAPYFNPPPAPAYKSKKNPIENINPP